MRVRERGRSQTKQRDSNYLPSQPANIKRTSKKKDTIIKRKKAKTKNKNKQKTTASSVTNPETLFASKTAAQHVTTPALVQLLFFYTSAVLAAADFFTLSLFFVDLNNTWVSPVGRELLTFSGSRQRSPPPPSILIKTQAFLYRNRTLHT